MLPMVRSSVVNMPRSGIREVMDLAWATPNVIHLEVGEPDFATPEHIGRAAEEAIRRQAVRYTPNAGIVELREAMAAKIRVRNGFEVGADQIIVGAGAVQSIYGMSRPSLISTSPEICRRKAQHERHVSCFDDGSPGRWHLEGL
jgi:aspartate/methionine/tyrosine aminotransferase